MSGSGIGVPHRRQENTPGRGYAKILASLPGRPGAAGAGRRRTGADGGCGGFARH